ncbi:MAG TPA: PhzF family phenazine biosynthesis isomerase [Kineosporiaceae bacterium]|nr:PhzF family phenazine biosynthesis isomerase [Kineosporiaceae bacterium]
MSGGRGGSAAVVMVEACLRGGTGGSPTAVVPNGEGIDDVELARIPARLGTSHVAVIYPDTGSASSRTLRFFTAEAELPGCGHGTVAAIAVLALQHAQEGFRGRLRVAGRDFEATGSVRPEPAGGNLVDAWFDQGIVRHRGARADESAAFVAALGLGPNALHPADEIAVASPGRERLMIPVVDRTVLAGIRPDQERLAGESRRFGQLGCFVYVPPSGTRPAAARMFAPAIGVPEDVANANSSGCLAAHLLITGRNPTVAVEQGDALGRPSTVQATAGWSAAGIVTRVGGTARITSS